MTEAKHTPGPWELWTGCSWRRFGSKTTGTEVVVPTNHPIDGHPDLLFPNGGQDGPDAALITAAPELHRELAHLVRLLEPMEREGTLNIPGLATLNGARAALAKAESR